MLGGERPEFPKRLPLLANTPNRDYWIRFFENQYQEECKRLGIQPEPQQLGLDGKPIWPTLSPGS